MKNKVEVRGLAVASVLKYVEEKKGKEGLEEVLASLDDESRKVLSNIVPKDWYPYDAVLKLMEAIVKLIGKGDPNIAREIGEFIAEDNTKWFLKLFLRFATPREVVKRWPVIWKFYFRGSELQLAELNEKSVITRAINFPNLKHIICEVLRGWGMYSLKAAGAKNIRIEEKKCREKGDEYTEWLNTWE